MEAEAPITSIHTNGVAVEVERVRSRLQSYIDEHAGVSISSVARAVGRGKSTMSQFLADKYPGNQEKLANQVADWLQREQERHDRPSTGASIDVDGLVTTSTLTRVQQVCRMAHVERDIAVIIGEAGVGKTRACRAYGQNNGSTIYIEVGAEYTTLGLAKELHAEVAGLDGSGTIYSLMQDVYDALQDSDRLLIIDQAEILPTRALEILRRIHDVAGIGLVLAGMPRLFQNIRGAGEHRQLYSRVGLKARVNGCTEDDVAKIMQLHLGRASERLVAKLMDDEITNTRVLSKLLKRASHIASMNDVEVSPEVLDKAKQMLII